MQQAAWRADGRWARLAGAGLSLLVLLMILPEGLDYARLAAPTVTTSSLDGSGSPLGHLLWMLVLGSSTALVLWRAGLAQRVLANLNLWFVGLLLLAALSLGWSIDPALTTRRLVRVLTLVLCLFAFVCTGWHERRLQSVLRPLLTSFLLASLAFGVGWPEYAIHRELSAELVGAWRGLTSHKNALGGLAATTCLLWCHAGVTREAPRPRSWVGFGIGFLCLLLSRSTTSLLATLFTCGLLLAFLPQVGANRSRLRWVTRPALALTLLLGLGSVSSMPGLSLFSAPVALLAGKDGSLTGRTAIWELVRDHIARRPLFGSGYGAYWEPNRGIGTESAVFVKRLEGFYPGSSHNGYLEVTNDLGVCGLLLLSGYLVSYVREAVRCSTREWTQGLLCLALWLQQALTNFSESHWFNVTSVDFVFLSVATFTLARQRVQREFLALHGPVPVVAQWNP
jgi:O-antigen ligase